MRTLLLVIDVQNGFVNEQWTREGITSWDFGELPAEVPDEEVGAT